MANLKTFTNGTDTYIAESAEDVLTAFKEFTGEDYILDDYGEKDDWWECDPEDFHSIHFEDKTKDFSDKFEILSRKEGYVRAKAKNKYWAEWNGRGFLCSTEF